MELPFTKFELAFIFIAFTVFSILSIALVYQFTWRSNDSSLSEEDLRAQLKTLNRRVKQRRHHYVSTTATTTTLNLDQLSPSGSPTTVDWSGD